MKESVNNLGGVEMDIKKEIILFEKHAQKFFTTNEAFTKENDNYIYDEVKFMWDCWITAKQQAVPKGYCVAPVEPTDEMCKKMFAGIKDGHDIQSIYKSMIQEAQK